MFGHPSGSPKIRSCCQKCGRTRADHAALTHGSEQAAAAWPLRAAWEPATGRLRFDRGGEAAPRAAAASHGAVRHTGLEPERAETWRATTAHMPPPTCGFARTHMLEPTCRTHMLGMLRLPWWCQSVPTTAAWDARLRAWAAPCTLEARASAAQTSAAAYSAAVSLCSCQHRSCRAAHHPG